MEVKPCFDWTAERIELLTQLWSSKTMSASKIAKRLGPGCTRSAVIGKVHRLGLNGKGGLPSGGTSKREARLLEPTPTGTPKKIRRQGWSNITRALKPAPQITPRIVEQPEPPAPEPETGGIPWVTAPPNACTNIMGDPRRVMICGQPKVVGQSYCRNCMVVIYSAAYLAKIEREAA
jgi:GcrA cell cycle regulator